MEHNTLSPTLKMKYAKYLNIMTDFWQKQSEKNAVDIAKYTMLALFAFSVLGMVMYYKVNVPALSLSVVFTMMLFSVMDFNNKLKRNSLEAFKSIFLEHNQQGELIDLLEIKATDEDDFNKFIQRGSVRELINNKIDGKYNISSLAMIEVGFAKFMDKPKLK